MNDAPTLLARRPTRSIALVGLMGVGKTSVGKRLASALGLPFRDADHEIETAAGCARSPTSSPSGERRSFAPESGG